MIHHGGHGKWRIMPYQVAGWFSVVLISCIEHNCDFTSAGEKRWYAPKREISEPYFSSGCWVEIDRRCLVEIICTQLCALQTHLFIHYKTCCSTGYLSTGNTQYWLTSKHHNSIHQLLLARSNTSLRARGHVGCLVEFHPASQSEE